MSNKQATLLPLVHLKFVYSKSTQEQKMESWQTLATEAWIGKKLSD